MDAEERARVRTLSRNEVFDKFTQEYARLEAEIERLADGATEAPSAARLNR
jgi:hypothetical protein